MLAAHCWTLTVEVSCLQPKLVPALLAMAKKRGQTPVINNKPSKFSFSWANTNIFPFNLPGGLGINSVEKEPKPSELPHVHASPLLDPIESSKHSSSNCFFMEFKGRFKFWAG